VTELFETVKYKYSLSYVFRPQLRERVAEVTKDSKQVEKTFWKYYKNFCRYSSAALPLWTAREISRSDRRITRHGSEL